MQSLFTIKDEVMAVCDDDSAFIDYCKSKLDALGNIDHWQLVADTAASIQADAGLSHFLTQQAIPLVTGENHKELFACLIFTGCTSANILHLDSSLDMTNSRDSNKIVSTPNFSTVSKVLQGSPSHKRYTSNIEFPSEIRSPNIYEDIQWSAPESTELKKGDVIVHDRRNTIIVHDDISPSVMLAICNPKKRSKYQYAFHKETRRLSHISEFEPKISRKEKAIRILEKYGNASSLPALMVASENDRHTIRWLALRAMICLDPEKKDIYLQKGACDDNKNIRETCEKLIEKYRCV
ncbi:hypothetical protein LYZ74_06445 [Xanthomonas hortorum pv. gardneri]|uniref:hypothetical protein n=1 Tax=Xanthomonas hortorum TaxID=56454 RepID=UPI0001FD4F85|nr:hypothetical protein [Xanthomonas hortorum]EGD16420.1 hypothetical protein XGA_5018 [Xanthomonas hortorum ATCC 19865]MCC8512907.1 hypothetical protein [Xanthomonas hortorum pv. gardneri]MCE4314711.1 hypothetical protein [Xanthomonas hortorum pv. gardneri]NMI47541.1 hypothetical protein [Xanthomonas hortorum pv. gardneri]